MPKKLPMLREKIARIIADNKDKPPSYFSQLLDIRESTARQIARENGIKLDPGPYKKTDAETMEKRIEWVKQQKGKKTIKEIAIHFGISYDTAWQMIIKKNLPYKSTDRSYRVREEESGSGYFNVNKLQNWLIGNSE